MCNWVLFNTEQNLMIHTTVKLITPPATEPVTLDEAKLHCRADTDTTEDSLIQAYISAARVAAEKRTSRALITQTWELALDSFEDKIQLMYPPILSIDSVKYKDGAGVEQTVPPADYAIFNYGEFGHYVFSTKGWPAGSDIRIQYKAGYGLSGSDVPASIVSWIKLAVGSLYASRESITTQQGATYEIPDSFIDNLLNPYVEIIA